MKFKKTLLWVIIGILCFLFVRSCQSTKEFKQLEEQQKQKINKEVDSFITKGTINSPKDSAQIIKEALAYSKLKKSYDEIEKYHWYKNSFFTHYINDTHISLYIGLKEGYTTPFMRLKLSCVTTDVLGMDMIVLYCDGNTMELPIDYFKERNFDNNGRVCWEWVDISIKENYISFIEKMSKGSDVRIRFKGHKFSKDHNVTKTEKQALEQVILGYNNFFN